MKTKEMGTFFDVAVFWFRGRLLSSRSGIVEGGRRTLADGVM